MGSVDAHPREQGSMIIGWLSRLSVSIGLLAIVLYDAGAVGVAHLRAMDTAPNGGDRGEHRLGLLAEP